MTGGGGGSAQPSTTTSIQDVPAWEQSYLKNLLGQAQTIAQQPYQQFPGPQIAGFTPNQTASFNAVQNLPGIVAPTQNAAISQTAAAANTAGNIYNSGAPNVQASASYNPLQAVAPYLGQASQYNAAAAGQPWLGEAAGMQGASAANTQAATAYNPTQAVAPYLGAASQHDSAAAAQPWLNQAAGLQSSSAPDIQASTSYNPLQAIAPYLGQASQYDATAASQPWLGQAAGYQAMAANAASPQGIQNYMSPYTSSVVQGIQDTANQNWNQNIMPGINDKFIGSGQYASGRNAQVLGQAAGNFQTGLSANIANALQSGYNTAGSQAATQASLLGNLGSQSLTGAGTAGGLQTAQAQNVLNQGVSAAGATQNQAGNLLGAGQALGTLGTQALQGASTAGNVQNQQIGNLLNQGQTAGTATQQQASNLLGAGQQFGNLGSQALQGASTAGGLQSQQAQNLVQQGQTAGSATQQQASNLLNVGTTLGNLAATQGQQQLAAGTTLGNLATQQQSMGLQDAQALQAVGQQQQQLNQANLNTAQQNFQNQVNWPAAQTEYLNQIIRGLPTPTATTSSSQITPAYSISPLAGIGGTAAAGLSLLGPNGQLMGTARAKGGLIKGYAEGGMVDPEEDILTPLDYANDDQSALYLDAMDSGESVQAPNPLAPPVNPPLDTTRAPEVQYKGIDPATMQQNQLLALARGMLTPSLGGSALASLGQGLGAVQDIGIQQQQWNQKQQMLEQERAMQHKRLDIEQQRADDYHKLAGAREAALSPAAQINSTLTGEEYLKTLTPLRAANAKAAAEGRLAITPFLLKAPYGQQLLGDTMQYDPTFDAANSATRVSTRKDFLSGKSAQGITALNTAISHTYKLAKDYGALDNSDFPSYNKAKNALGNALGNRNIQTNTANISTDAEAVSHELAKVFRSTGMSEAEIKAWKEKISTDAAPASSKAVIDSALELMNGRLSAIGQQYNQGMKTSKEPIELLSPDAQKKYKELMGDTASGAQAAPAAGASAPSPLRQDIPAGAKLVGTSGGKKVYQLPDGSHMMEQ